MSAFAWTEPEAEAARKAGLIVFAGKVLYEARPPVDAKTLRRVEQRCSGPLPAALVDLWRLSLGGALDYDLRVRFGDHVASLSFRELFYPGSSHYRDLFGWIEQQEEVEQESGNEGKLRFLPIGGFEYLDRVYVQVAPGEHHGSVVVWMQGLPPAWRLRLHQDSSARIAPDLHSLFDQLVLEDDPADPTDPYSNGQDLWAALENLAEHGEIGASAAQKLRELVRSTVLDWRAAVEDGSVDGDERLRRLALEHVAAKDDGPLMERLIALGCDPTERISGGGTLMDIAMARGSLGVVNALLDLDVPVTDAICSGASSLDPELARTLLARGARVDQMAILRVTGGDAEVAKLLTNAFIARHPEQIEDLSTKAREEAARRAREAVRIEEGELRSSAEPEEERARAQAFLKLAVRLERAARQR